MTAGTGAALAALLALAAGAAAAQPAWEAEAGLGHERLSTGAPSWRQTDLALRHRFAPRALAELGLRRAERYGQADAELALGASLPLDARWTIGLRGTAADAPRFLPHRGLHGEATLALPGGWVASAGLGRNRYDSAGAPPTGTSQLRLGIERYLGPWRLAGGWTRARLDGGETGDGLRLQADRFFGDEARLGVLVASGEELENAPGGVLSTRVDTVVVLGRWPLGGGWALVGDLGRTRVGDLARRTGDRGAPTGSGYTRSGAASVFSEVSEPGLRVAYAIGLVSLTVAAGMVLQVFAMRLAGLRREKRLAALRARWRPVLAQAALGEADTVALPPLPARDRAELLLLWNQLQDGLRGSAHEGLNRLAARLGLHADARRFVRFGGLAERVIGVSTLGHLGLAEDTPLLEAALADPQSPISLGAARALLQLDAAAAAPRVLDRYLQRPDWPAARLGTLLRDAGAAAVAPALTERLLGGTLDAQLRLLPLLRFAETPHAGSVLHRLVERSEDPQLLSQALRQLHGPAARERVRALSSSADALVRSAAAQALGRVGDAADRDRLVAMLSDRDWWVRYRAAQALLALPGMNEAALDALHGSLADRFARDALAHVRAERAIAQSALPSPPGALPA